MRYAIFGMYYTLPVIIALNLIGQQLEFLVEVLKWFKKAIGWTIADIIRIHPVVVLTMFNSCWIISVVSSIRRD